MLATWEFGRPRIFELFLVGSFGEKEGTFLPENGCSWNTSSLLSFGGLGIPGVCSKGMLGVS